MKKELLTPENIKKDLLTIVNIRISNISDWRLSYIIPVTLIAVIIGILLKNIWIGGLIFSFAAYHIVRFILDARSCLRVKKELIKEINDCSFSVSVDKLEGISEEIVYEPHMGVRGSRSIKSVKVYRFQSGRQWRELSVGTHYKWSRLYNMSSKGLENTSVVGDEFYFVTLKSDNETAYVYNTNLFEYKDTVVTKKAGQL